MSLLTGFTQNNSISGKVINKITKQPVVGASVFISGTSRGTITNETGNFQLLNVPHGKYDLVVSNVSFQSYIRSFNTTELPLTLEVELESKITELEQVIIRPFDTDTWEKWGLLFTDLFIGTSSYAKHTSIKNKEAIKFRHYRSEQVLEAFSEGPIIIENKALGYIIQYQLEEFRYDMKEKKVIFLGFTLFEDLADDKRRVPRRWAYNRTNVYEGSMMHFFKALYNQNTYSSGYDVRILRKGKNHEKERVREIYQKIKNEIDSFGIVVRYEVEKDSLGYYNQILRQSDEIDYLENTLIEPEKFILDHNKAEKQFFFNDYLHIRYRKKLEDEEYVQFTKENRKPLYPISVIQLDEKNPIAVDRFGNFHPPYEIICYGYWAWSEKVATMLPLDYDPDEFLKIK